MLPRRQDVFDAVGAIKYGLGLTKDKPKIGRFGYVEKSEYWALVWGTVVMTATGVIMWMENTFIKLLTKLGWDIARTVHFYEAWLAVLAIIVWHLYFVIFNPDVYPMNAAWLTGTLPEDVLAKEHPLEYEKLRSEISAKKHGRSVESEKGEE
jgi:cytochrome b subunit of formate dehydrogenase